MQLLPLLGFIFQPCSKTPVLTAVCSLLLTFPVEDVNKGRFDKKSEMTWKEEASRCVSECAYLKERCGISSCAP